ncbi:MAG: hypothetical protein JW994_07730 [Candidatus Omnitrophica bacterium]|nr:hypothetical protein [Candidatus Omnitrophota bacterium]
MGRKTRTQIKFKQQKKRKKRRLKLTKKGRNPEDYFYSGFCVSRKAD